MKQTVCWSLCRYKLWLTLPRRLWSKNHFFRQKSRINWLREDDLNTAYFFRICQVRACYNAVRAFLTNSGDWIVDSLEMSSHAISHFQSVLAPAMSKLVVKHSSPDWFHSLQAFRVTAQAAQMLTIPTAEEIKRLIFKLNPNKAPCPDGLTSAFFRASWEIVGEDVVRAVWNFFASAFLPTTANATILSLVPKFSGAYKVTDYRPISFLNTVYKVVSRLLVRRLKPMLPKLILACQTAFIKGRLIIENTTLASELINGYHRNKGAKKITIKVYITKAFDTLFW